MKLIKALMLVTVLAVIPTFAIADKQDLEDENDDSGDVTGPAVPEPSGALVMGVALSTVALVARRQRK